MHTRCMSGAYRGQRRVYDSLRLELEMVVGVSNPQPLEELQPQMKTFPQVSDRDICKHLEMHTIKMSHSL